MDETCIKIVGMMGAALAAETVVIRVLWGVYRKAQAKYHESQEARVKQAEEHKRELETVKDMLEARKKRNRP